MMRCHKLVCTDEARLPQNLVLGTSPATTLSSTDLQKAVAHTANYSPPTDGPCRGMDMAAAVATLNDALTVNEDSVLSTVEQINAVLRVHGGALDAQAALKADKAYVDSQDQLKADKSVVGAYTTPTTGPANGQATIAGAIESINSQFASKADKSYVDAQDALKADKSVVGDYTPMSMAGGPAGGAATISAALVTINKAFSNKADTTYVDVQNMAKADRTYVDSQDLLKADKAYTDTQLGTKADKSIVGTYTAPTTGPASGKATISDAVGAINVGLNTVSTTVGTYSAPATGPAANQASIAAAIASISTAWATKADKTYVDTQDSLKADKAYTDTQLGTKADKTYTDTQLGTKADKTYTDTQLGAKADKSVVGAYTAPAAGPASGKATISDAVIAFNNQFTNVDIYKADRTYVDAQIAPKADKTYVDAQNALKADKSIVGTYTAPTSGPAVSQATIAGAVGSINSQFASKADKTYVDAQDALKADRAYVDAQNGLLTASKAESSVVGSYIIPTSGPAANQTTIAAAVGSINSQFWTKADKTYVDSQNALKADKTYVDSRDALKADKTYVDAQLSWKADLQDVGSYIPPTSGPASGQKTIVAAVGEINSQFVNKAYIDSQDALKADKTYTDTQLGTKADKTYTDTQLGTKADKTYVDTQDALKADKTYVDTQAALKADKSVVGTYTTPTTGPANAKTTIADAVTAINTQFVTKADKTYVDTQDGLKADKSMVGTYTAPTTGPANAKTTIADAVAALNETLLTRGPPNLLLSVPTSALTTVPPAGCTVVGSPAASTVSFLNGEIRLTSATTDTSGLVCWPINPGRDFVLTFEVRSGAPSRAPGGQACFWVALYDKVVPGSWGLDELMSSAPEVAQSYRIQFSETNKRVSVQFPGGSYLNPSPSWIDMDAYVWHSVKVVFNPSSFVIIVNGAELGRWKTTLQPSATEPRVGGFGLGGRTTGTVPNEHSVRNIFLWSHDGALVQYDALSASKVDKSMVGTYTTPTTGPANAKATIADAVVAINTQFANKADKTYVDAQDGLKADKTYVDTQDGLKADKSVVGTYTAPTTGPASGKTTVGDAVAAVNSALTEVTSPDDAPPRYLIYETTDLWASRGKLNMGTFTSPNSYLIADKEARLTDAFKNIESSGIYWNVNPGKSFVLSFEFRAGNGTGYPSATQTGDGLAVQLFASTSTPVWWASPTAPPAGSYSIIFWEYQSIVAVGVPDSTVKSLPVSNLGNNTWRKATIIFGPAALVVKINGVTILSSPTPTPPATPKDTGRFVHIYARCGWATNEHAVRNVLLWTRDPDVPGYTDLGTYVPPTTGPASGKTTVADALTALNGACVCSKYTSIAAWSGQFTAGVWKVSGTNDCSLAIYPGAELVVCMCTWGAGAYYSVSGSALMGGHAYSSINGAGRDTTTYLRVGPFITCYYTGTSPTSWTIELRQDAQTLITGTKPLSGSDYFNVYLIARTPRFINMDKNMLPRLNIAPYTEVPLYDKPYGSVAWTGQ